jgi:hypothetical protein
MAIPVSMPNSSSRSVSPVAPPLSGAAVAVMIIA